MVKEKPGAFNKDKAQSTELCEMILFNDDVNTFDFVIDTLVEVCGHEPLQAEQCALITHYKGRCVVKTGPISELKPPCDEMTRRGLTVSID